MVGQRPTGLILGVRFDKIKKTILAFSFLIPLPACATMIRSPSHDTNSTLGVPAAPSSIRLEQGHKQSVKNSKEAVEIREVVEVQSALLPTNSNGSPARLETEPPKANKWQLESSNWYDKEFVEKTSTSQTNTNPTKTAGTSTPKDEWVHCQRVQLEGRDTQTFGGI